MDANIFNILSYILSGTAIVMLITAWVLCLCVASVYGIVNFRKLLGIGDKKDKKDKKTKAIAFPIALAAFQFIDIAMYMILLIENIALACLIIYLVHELKTAKFLIAQASAKSTPVIAAENSEKPAKKPARYKAPEPKQKAEVQRFRKKSFVNIDTLAKNFEDGDTVNLESLTAKKLVPKGTDYVKVLGRGDVNKQLLVEVNYCSPEAAKMIVRAGGQVKTI